MKHVTYAVLAISNLIFLISGCANSATRYSMAPGEGVYTFAHETTKEQENGFYLAEEWLASGIRNANDAITMRRLETGTLIANSSIPVPVVGVSFWMSYTMKITCSDNQITTMFTSGKLHNGTYPPKAAMPGIEEDFRLLSQNLLKYIEEN